MPRVLFIKSNRKKSSPDVRKTRDHRAPIHDIIARRWSPRAFDDSKPVPPHAIVSLCEAARWSPSSYGDEPWRYLVWDKLADPVAWHRAFSCFAESNQSWVKRAPLLCCQWRTKIFVTMAARIASPSMMPAWLVWRWYCKPSRWVWWRIKWVASTRRKFVHEFDVPEHFHCMR